MRKFRNIVSLTPAMVIAILLCACQQNPIEDVVTSKNDGSFDANSAISASEHHDPDATQNALYSETFFSTDKSVEFRLNIEETVTAADMPIVEVAPHFLTEKDVQRVANILFENAEIYESEPRLEPKLSQSDIREKLNRWVHYSNTDALKSLYGNQESNLKGKIKNIKNFIKEYSAMYEVAPKTNPHILCEWKFKKDSYYQYSAEVADARDTASENDVISAQVKLNDLRYTYRAAKRNRDDFKLNLISVYLDDGISPSNIDERIFCASICRTEEPTEEQIREIREKADAMLRKMELGEWLVDECYIETYYYADVAEYIVCVNAVPVLNEIPAIRCPQLSNLNSSEVYASNYYLTDVNFRFSANADLIDFRMYSPIDIVDVVNNNVAVMSLETLMAQAKTYLELSDMHEYGISSEIMKNYEQNGLDLDCIVIITDLCYNLIRVKVPNTDNSYYYVPGITLKGNVEYTDTVTGEIYFENNGVTLITINGVDGSVVNTTNG